MPLNDAIPQIDDRRFDSLLAEVRTRIPRYTPEWTPVWTDLNDNDPGITIVQVFAWLAEMLTYRMNKVPELNYIKFLQLIGIELEPAEPALAEITFPVVPTHPQLYVIVPARTQVTADAPDGGPQLVFETDRALVALTAKLAAVIAVDGPVSTDVTKDNEEASQGFEPFGKAADGDALMLGFDYAGEFPAVELDLAVIVATDPTAPLVLQCGLPDTPSFGPARVKWECWDGSVWRPVSLVRDATRAFTRSGHVTLKTAAKTLQRISIPAGTPPRFWIRARLEQSQYERRPRLLAIRTNTVSAQQAETIRDEVVGGSDGSRDQVFQLSAAPVLAGSLQLEVDQGDGFEAWRQVDDLFGSGPTAQDYVLNRTTGEIRFGDGVNGAIPVANASNPGANVVAREYRTGGGKRGNVPALAIKTVVTSIDGIDDGNVANLLAANSGRDEETLDEAKKRAPRTIRSRCRAVTADDFEYLAMQAATIKRAKALPLSHPDFPGVKVPGVVTVIVVPDSDDPCPIPSEGTLRTVCAYLDARRLLTTELYVIGPTYRQVEVQVEIVVADDADLAEVQQNVEQTLLDYFNPLRGGEDGSGWPFGGPILFSRVNQRVFTVAGVSSVTRLTIFVDGEEAPQCTDVTIGDGQLVCSTAHEVQVSYAFEEADA
jgi:predicted phage baseplate assembly protein